MNEKEHHINFGTKRRGGSMIAGGGNARESYVYCSCGWESRSNGQSYAESRQEAVEHLKGENVWTTASDQTVYAWVHDEGAKNHTTGEPLFSTLGYLIRKTEKSVGIVQRSLDKLIERGNVVKVGNAYYRTEKPFSWGI